MKNGNLNIGDILRVKQGKEYHFEKVVQLIPNVLTEDMPEQKDADVSIQGIADNLEYEIVPNYRIATALKRVHFL